MKTNLAILKDLKKDGFIIYKDDAIVTSAPREDRKKELEFFNLGKNVTNQEIINAYHERGLVPASFVELANYIKKNPKILEEKKWIATVWDFNDDVLSYAAFRRWVGERGVLVSRSGRGWGDGWWFAGLRKSSETLGSKTFGPLNLESRVKSLEADMEKIKKFLIV